MPVYEFRCTQCGRSFDVRRPREEAGAPASCPHDGADGQRVFAFAVALGGSSVGDFDFGGAGEMPDMGGMGDMSDFGDMDF